MEKISIIVPVYNCAGELGRCLDSLLAQSYENTEIVAVDDGSTDSGRRVLERYAAEHPQIRPVYQANGGVTAARLAGVRAAQGDWIGFVDGDDRVDPDMYRFLYDMAREAGADIAHCGHRILFPDGRTQYVHNTGRKFTRDTAGGLTDLLDGGQIDSSLCTKLFRRELFDGIGEWMDTRLRNGEDLLMNFYLFSRAGRSVYEDRCPYQYILRAGSASRHAPDEHSLFDPVRSRELIVQRCDAAMQPEARRALLRNLLFAYALASRQRGEQAAAYRQRAREKLRQNRAWFPLLSRRNRILADMILDAPWSFNVAYGVYVSLFQREEQH